MTKSAAATTEELVRALIVRAAEENGMTTEQAEQLVANFLGPVAKPEPPKPEREVALEDTIDRLLTEREV